MTWIDTFTDYWFAFRIGVCLQIIAHVLLTGAVAIGWHHGERLLANAMSSWHATDFWGNSTTVGKGHLKRLRAEITLFRIWGVVAVSLSAANLVVDLLLMPHP